MWSYQSCDCISALEFDSRQAIARQLQGMEDRHVLQLIAVLAFITITWRLVTNHRHDKPLLRSVAILVLGDIGRSPRMMYHAESFAKNGYETFLIGYAGA